MEIKNHQDVGFCLRTTRAWPTSGAVASISDHPDIRRVVEGLRFEMLDICYTTTNQRQGEAEISGEVRILNREPTALGGLF